MCQHPAWKSWLKLVALFTFLQKREFSMEDIERLDDMQLDYMDAFDQVPEYVGLKRPKHHFLSHVSLDIYRHGPPSEYWCFGFESFNKTMKAGARLSNCKHIVRDVMEYWSVLSARDMQIRAQRGLVSGVSAKRQRV
jgi:hypothetical protein